MAFISLSRRNASKDERIASRRLPEGARCVLEHVNGSACYLYDRGGKPCAVTFLGSSAKVDKMFSFRDEDRRAAWVQEWKARIEAATNARSVAQQRRTAEGSTLVVGDIVYTCWGYDQTNTEFYVVTRRVGKTRVYVRAIKADYEATGFMSGRTWPAMPIEAVGPETMHIGRGDSININGHHASKETGRDHYVSSYA